LPPHMPVFHLEPIGLAAAAVEREYFHLITIPSRPSLHNISAAGLPEAALDAVDLTGAKPGLVMKRYAVTGERSARGVAAIILESPVAR